MQHNRSSFPHEPASLLSARRLDAVWSRLPFPYSRSFTVERFASLRTVRMARRYFGHEFLPVYCYVVGDTLVDSGLACYGDELAALVSEVPIRRAVITHHHEDHAGNAALLAARGVEVLAAAATSEIVAHDVPLHFYQHLLWGKMRPARTGVLPDRVPIGPYLAEVIPAPGHCADQVVFYIREEGWLFSGDAFLSERVKVFRRDEDFAASVATLERLLGLDFDALLCAHKPRTRGGKQALAAKLGHLRELEGEVRRLHAAGHDSGEISRRLIRTPLSVVLTAGDATPANLVRSILFGPTQRG